MTTIQDDRTPEQKLTHNVLVIGTDRCLSGWGGASGGASYAAWACTDADSPMVERWVRCRHDMNRVRVTVEGITTVGKYRPGSRCAHLHVYVVGPDHPARRG